MLFSNHDLFPCFRIYPNCVLPETLPSLLPHWVHVTSPSATSATLSVTVCLLYVPASLELAYSLRRNDFHSPEILTQVILGWHFQRLLNKAQSEYHAIFIKALLIHLNSQCENMSPHLHLHHLSFQFSNCFINQPYSVVLIVFPPDQKLE